MVNWAWTWKQGYTLTLQVERTTVQLEEGHSLLTFLKLLDLLLQFSKVGGVHLVLGIRCLKVSDSLFQCFLLLRKQLQGEK